MNTKPDGQCCTATPYVIAALGTFLIVAGLVWVLHTYTQPTPLGAERAAERRKALLALQAENASALNSYAWQNEGRGLVRLPIDQAIKLALGAAAKSPAGLRGEVISRLEKSTPKPVSFE